MAEQDREEDLRRGVIDLCYKARAKSFLISKGLLHL